jgi:hypothetical protein
MSLKRTLWARAPWAVLSAGWVTAMGLLAWAMPDGSDLLPALAVTPALTVAAGARRLAVLASGGLALAALGTDIADRSVGVSGRAAGAAGAVLAVIAAGMWTAGRRSVMTAELDRTREIAAAAQQVLLPSLPRKVGGLLVTGEYVSASHGARIGGDFYEVLATPFGVRVLIGDARGHGLPAIGLVAALLGSFREAAHQEPELPGVLCRLDGAMQRHLAERAGAAGAAPEEAEDAEEFATLQIVQLTEDGTLLAVNCGHPVPYVLGPRTGPLPLAEPLPPLGLFDPSGTPVVVSCDRLEPGEGLLLHTDGVAEARDTTGRFFPLAEAVAALAARRVRGADVAPMLRAAVTAHTGGRCDDDLALLVLLRDRGPRCGVPLDTALSAS